jgi:tetratricopeptide (TPR) repeat protein
MQIINLSKWNWVTPFQGGLYYGYHSMAAYLRAISDVLDFRADDEYEYHQNITEGVDAGLLRLIPGDYALLRVHPLWQIRMQKKVDKSALKKIQAAYHIHVRSLAPTLVELVVCGVSERAAEAHTVMSVEWPNLRQVLRQSGRRGEPTEALSVALRYYFKAQGRLECWLPEALFLLDTTTVYSNNRAARIEALDDVATTLLELFRPKEARLYLEESWNLCQAGEKSTDEDIIRLCAVCDGMARSSTEFSEQKAWLERAADMAHHAGLTNLWVRISYNLSELLAENGKLEESRRILESLMAITKKGIAKGILARIALSFALHSQRAGKFREARRYFREALRYKPNTILEAEIRQDMASAYFEEGKIQQAKRQLELAIPIFIQTGNEKQMGNAFNVMSVISFQEGEYQSGLEYAFKALECFANTSQWSLTGQVYYNLALWCYSQKWWSDSVRYTHKAQEQFDRVGNRLLTARQQMLRAAAMIGMGRLRAARSWTNLAKAILNELDDRTELANIRSLEETLLKAYDEKRSKK